MKSKTKDVIEFAFMIFAFTLIISGVFHINGSEKYPAQEKNEEEIVYDDFTVQMEDINGLVEGGFCGCIYFGRDTCPNCLNFNAVLKNIVAAENRIVLYKFDTDRWRQNENFQIILDKFSVSQIPALVRIDDDASVHRLTLEGQTMEGMTSNLRVFLQASV